MTTTAPRSPIPTAGWRTPIRPKPRPGSKPKTSSPSTTCATSPRGTASTSARPNSGTTRSSACRTARASRYFFSKNTGLQNQSVVYMAPAPDAPATELLDPNKLSADGTVSLSSYAISDDGKYMAYGLNTSGSDWINWRVKDIATGQDLPDQIQWSKFSGASWTKDGRGFFYSGYDEPDAKSQLQAVNYYQKLYYHRVGDRAGQGRTRLRAQGREGMGLRRHRQRRRPVSGHRRDPRHRPERTASSSARWATARARTARRSWSCCRDGDARYQFVGNDGAVFYFSTDKDAPRGRFVAIDTSKRAVELREIIPQTAETLESVSYVGGRFLASYLKDAHTQVKVFDKEGKLLSEVVFPGLGTAAVSTASRTTRRRSIPSPATPPRPRSTATTCAPARRSPCSRRSSTSTRPTTRPNRSSIRARTARRCRCSSRTRRGCKRTARTRPCSTATAAFPFR